MAVLPVEKVQIVVHKSIKDEFLHKLQLEGIVHVTDLKETAAKTSDEIARIETALAQLSGFRKRHPLSMFFSMKRRMSYDDLVDSTKSSDQEDPAATAEKIKVERDALLDKQRRIEEKISVLTPWRPFDGDLESLRAFRQTECVPTVVLSDEALQAVDEATADIPHSVEDINVVGTSHYCLFFVIKEQAGILRTKLVEEGCELVDLSAHAGVPAATIDRLGNDLQKTRARLAALDEEETELAKNIGRLEAMSDLMSIAQEKDDVASALPETVRTMNVTGWILRRNIPRLDRLIKKSGLAFYDRIEPNPDERPPIALQNPSPSKPYEMLVRLYSMPDPREYDPTPFLAFFFPVMFGLCITDAIYGIVLILASIYLMRRVTGDKSLFKILLVGGILTIFAGAMVGGWAGDIFEYIGFEPLIRMKNSLMLFDPVKQPMTFIGLALGIGFIHMMLGIAIEVVDNIKNGEYNQAIFANLTWFIILPSIILYFSVLNSSLVAKAILEIVLWACLMGIIVASHPEGVSSPLDQIVWAFIVWILWYFGTSAAAGLLQFKYVIQVPKFVLLGLIPLIAVEIIRFRQMKAILGKLAWGLYNIYGISNYLGVLLSYVRLMALGMVTGVIGIAINKIAWMVTGIPVLGILLVIMILIPAHLFNLVINTLGGFIHTMRLQYIEFFGRFYSGGSKPFKPFRLETNYVEIKQ